MQQIKNAVIRLQPGQSVDAYVLVEGQLVPVHIERDGDQQSRAVVGPYDNGSDTATVRRYEPLDIKDIASGDYSGGQTALVVNSDEDSVDLARVLRTAAVGDWQGLGKYDVRRSATSEKMLTVSPADIDVVMEFNSPLSF